MSDFTYKMNMVIIQLVHAFKELATPIKNEFTRDYPKLECKTYGFDCDFISIGIPEKVIKDFRDHTFFVHHIDYPEGVIMKFITRKFLKKEEY